ncbi:MAG: hypothetical protein KGO49_02940 [Gammaproteobacteria bacterium]|nr:hypothetical protein [Gammaproteobacteria bacterium]
MIVQHTQKLAAVIALSFALHAGQTLAAPATTTPTASPQVTATAPTPATAAKPEPTVIKPPTLETQFANLSKLSKTQSSRLDQLEAANRDALTRNQALQLENDNLSVQVKALQSDRSAQMFIYGAVAILVGAIIGYIIASQFLRNTRRW